MNAGGPFAVRFYAMRFRHQGARQPWRSVVRRNYGLMLRLLFHAIADRALIFLGFIPGTWCVICSRRLKNPRDWCGYIVFSRMLFAHESCAREWNSVPLGSATAPYAVRGAIVEPGRRNWQIVAIAMTLAVTAGTIMGFLVAVQFLGLSERLGMLP